MSIGQLPVFRGDGRLRGVYVYMLLCKDDGPVYVKVGITVDLHNRLMALRNGCPVTPRQFHSFEVRSKRRALLIEGQLHEALDSWSAHGEWFMVPMADKAAFNAAWRAVTTVYRESGWPCEWSRVPVAPLVRHNNLRRQYLQWQYAKIGMAERDARKHCLTAASDL